MLAAHGRDPYPWQPNLVADDVSIAASNAPALMAPEAIELRGVCVHNLRNVDLDVPLQRLVAVSGVSGSGKSSLAFDTLAAEGQRRYIESFSPYARQFLERPERPDADRIDHIPPAVAVRQQAGSASRRATVATATEIHDSLRVAYARTGTVFCPRCGVAVRRDDAASAEAWLHTLPAGTRAQIGFAWQPDPPLEWADMRTHLREAGFTRVVVGDRQLDLSTEPAGPAEFSPSSHPGEVTTTTADAEKPASSHADVLSCLVLVDRVAVGNTSRERIADSLELAFARGDGQCSILWPAASDGSEAHNADNTRPDASASLRQIDGRDWRIRSFRNRRVCGRCGDEFPDPEPRQLSFNSVLGACPRCEGLGVVTAIALQRVVPDASKSIRDGAIACWNTPAYRHELDELLRLAPKHGLPVDVPFHKLHADHLRIIEEGVPEERFGGLRGFFEWLEQRRYKVAIAAFLSRWRSLTVCPACHGRRLQPRALAVKVLGINIAEWTEMTINAALGWLDRLPQAWDEPATQGVWDALAHALRARLTYLQRVGLGYLTLDRPLPTLSSGEQQRVSLTAALGSNLVNTLFVLDEPTCGLHARDVRRLIEVIRDLQQADNSVVVVEHDPSVLRSADWLIDVGPGAGRAGGMIVHQGSPADLCRAEKSVTADYLCGRRAVARTMPPRTPTRWLELHGARTHNLAGSPVRFPLEVLCAVTGVSGSGKSSLVLESLFPALCRELQQDPGEHAGTWERLEGADQINEVLALERSPASRTPRSNPATYLKIFDDIRRMFAETPEARARNYTSGQFSFNTEHGGRCPTCRGTGEVSVDMQFLPDVTMTCPDCHGTRFRPELLEIKLRGLSIADVLNLTVQEAFLFLRGETRLQRRLKFLKDVGLGYLTLGQPADTLSGGEAQRLKLAAFLTRSRRARCLFLLDEPTTGLHPADLDRLLAGFDALLAAGHSLIVIEHDLDLIRCADYIIDLGPGAGPEGGRVVATGTPVEVAAAPASATGACLTAAAASPK